MDSQAVIDLAAALDRFDGDQGLFLTLANLFVERSAGSLEAIRIAMQDRNLPMLVTAAHTLKGSALEFCAHPAVAAAAQLEESARQGAWHDTAAISERVHAEVQRLTDALEVFIEKGFHS